MQGDRELCLAAGMDDYITKPIRVDELVGALSQAKTQPAAAPPAAAALDDAVLAKLRADVGEDFIGELIDAFLEDAPELIASMKTALAQNDVEAFRRAAHSLKSNSMTFGANELAETAKGLEEAGKSGNLAGVEERLAFVETEFDRVRRALEAQRQT
jgi:HPt (histidine-containing phosphotransfer) domain-containing protein